MRELHSREYLDLEIARFEPPRWFPGGGPPVGARPRAVRRPPPGRWGGAGFCQSEPRANAIAPVGFSSVQPTPTQQSPSSGQPLSRP